MALIELHSPTALWTARTPTRIEVEDLAPRPLAAALSDGYPSLLLERGLLRMAIHALRTPHRFGDVIPVPNAFLADVFGQPELARAKRFLSQEKVERLAAALDAPTPGRSPVDVALYPFDFRRKMSYAIELRGVPDDIAATAAESRDVPADDRISLDGWVRVEPSGSVVGLDHDTPSVRRAMEEGLRDPEGAVPITLRLQGYLNGLATAVFAPLRRAIGEPSTGAFVREAFPDGQRRGHVVATLRGVVRQPVPIYQTSPKTPRVHAVGRNATALPSSLRQRLTEEVGWVEVDLAHAQLACNARAWGVPGALRVLEEPGYELWSDLMAHLGAPPDLRSIEPALYQDLKDVLKPTVHGVSFGMRPWKVRRFGLEGDASDEPHVRATLAEACGQTLEHAGASLVDHPVVGAMLAAREAERERVYAEGGRHDVLGKWWPLAKRSEWKSILARCAQAHEMLLLEPVIDDAIGELEKHRPLYRIVLWQHDGFTVSPKGGEAARVTRRLCRLVRERAQLLGVPTGLRVDVGPDGVC